MSKPQLIISQPGQRTRRVEIEKNLVSIGRKTDNTIALEGDTSVSKYHAVIELRDDGFWLSDLDSRNGTTVNEQPVRTEYKLTNGDLICVGGQSTVEFLLPATGADVPPPDAAAPSKPAAESSPPPQPQTPPAPPAPEQKSGGSSLMLVAGIVGGLVVVGALVALLFATGVLGGSSNKNSADDDARASSSSARRRDSDSSADDAGVSGGDTGFVEDAASGKASAPPATLDNSGASVPPLPATVEGVGAPVGDPSSVEPLARTLAVQIAQKSLYSFDPAFINLIQNYTNEYRTAAGYSERARKYRDAIDREFVNVQGIQPPLIGYVLAMSRSKFIEREAGGVWALPASVRSNTPDGANDTAADPTAASTRLAASYIKDLLDLFGRDQFMYAVACYGMTLDDAGRVKTELERRDPTGQTRYDFWKMKQAGVVRGEQVERVARFFAAGIVAENPQRFGLKDRPLSSLYDL